MIDLDNPYNLPRVLHHLTSWEVADVQWSPHASQPSWVVSTSNQKALLWDLSASAGKAIRNVIHGHSRAITDINFHSKNPKLLATSSIDSYIHCWDLENTQKPCLSFAEFFSGATQVKWNRHNDNILASSHDTRVIIWDRRKNSIPIKTINAHTLKVNGLDFSRTDSTTLMTCSNDRTVKIWNFEKDIETPTLTIETDYPVGRARFTPFGTGAVIMPSRGGSNSLSLVNIENNTGYENLSAVHEFKAHTKPVREFVWRPKGGKGKMEDRDFQVVTWSEDKDLRLWPVQEETLAKVGYEKGKPIQMPLTRRGAKYETYHTEPAVNLATGQSEKKSSIKVPRSSYGSSPGTLRNHFSHAGFSNRSKPGIPATFMTRADDRGKDSEYEENYNSPLQWISGIRIGPSAFNELTSNGNKNSPKYEDYKNLGEEVSWVGRVFPRINFKNISLQTKELTVELNGSPNGFENELIFLRVNINFPIDYPAEPPIFCIEENYKLGPEDRQSIEVELNVFAEKLAKRKKYCLEPCLRILLGEKLSPGDFFRDEKYEIESISADESNDFESVEMNIESSSSSEDETQPIKLNKVPIPKRCGAYWSKTGQLVCFFMPKKPERSSSNTDKANPVATNMLQKPLASNNTNSDDESNVFTSDYDDSDDTTPVRWHHPGRMMSKIRVKNIGNTSVSESARATIVAEDKSKNVIKILDLRDLIPAKRELANKYVIEGQDILQLCDINAQVALNDSLEVSDCWKLIKLLLSTQLSITKSNEFLDKNSDIHSLAKGAFQWGMHPFGRIWLIDQLFDYFERKQNPQMLANMSCIFASATTPKNTLPVSLPSMLSLTSKSSFNRFSDRAVRKREGTASHSAVNTPFFSGKINPWDFVMFSPGSYNAKNDGALSLTAENMSTPITKSNQTIIDPNRASPTFSKSSSVESNSPEKISNARRAIKGLNGIFSRSSTQLNTQVIVTPSATGHKRESSYASISNLGPLTSNFWPYNSNTNNNSSPTASVSNSPKINSIVVNPPNSSIRRGDSDNDLNFSLTFDTTPTTRLPSRNSVIAYTEPTVSTIPDLSSVPKVRLTILDETTIDHAESLPAATLLDPSQAEKYDRYRTQYAALLFTWGFEFQSLEVLKFNYRDQKPRVLMSSQAKKQQLKDDPYLVNVRDFDLDIKKSEIQYEPNDESKHSPLKANKSCQYCGLKVKKRYSFCWKCEHILHATCAEEWWEDYKVGLCPSGCGCQCLTSLS